MKQGEEKERLLLSLSSSLIVLTYEISPIVDMEVSTALRLKNKTAAGSIFSISCHTQQLGYMIIYHLSLDLSLKPIHFHSRYEQTINYILDNLQKHYYCVFYFRHQGYHKESISVLLENISTGDQR